MSMLEHSYLRRLDSSAYQGLAIVHWSHSINDRKRGWLTPRFHQQFREILIHAGGRFSLWCPSYCLMPDHFHVVWMGVSDQSDQLSATQWLRRHLNLVLQRGGFELQRQAHDRVLREHETGKNAFEDLVSYVLENPERAALVDESAPPSAWPYRDSIVPGYPDISWQRLSGEFWDPFWRAYHYTIAQNR